MFNVAPFTNVEDRSITGERDVTEFSNARSVEDLRRSQQTNPLLSPLRGVNMVIIPEFKKPKNEEDAWQLFFDPSTARPLK